MSIIEKIELSKIRTKDRLQFSGASEKTDKVSTTQARLEPL